MSSRKKCQIIPFPAQKPSPEIARPIAPTFTIADLYAGIGGFHLAFRDVGAECVVAVEKDSHARKTYERNFKNGNGDLFDRGHFFEDVVDLADHPDRLPDFDILTAGFPCQPFSIAGKKKGFADARGNHFFVLLKILKAKQPQAFFLENVRGLLSLENGAVFRCMQSSIEALGYSFHWRIIRACDFGVPQLRPRLFLVGFRNPSLPFTFPSPIPLKITMSDVFGAPCNRRIGKTILRSGRGKHWGAPFNWDCFLVDGKERWLTSREVIQMQGFPDSFVFPVPEDHRMMLLGNSVAIPAVRAVAEEILRTLRGTSVSARTVGRIAA